MPLAHAGGIPRLERNDRYVYDTNRGPMTLLLCGTPSVIIYGADPVYEIHACCETRGGTLSQGTTLNPQSAHMVSSLSQRGKEWSLYEWAADGSVMRYPVTGFVYGTPPRKDESRGQAVAGDAATYDMCGARWARSSSGARYMPSPACPNTGAASWTVTPSSMTSSPRAVR